MTHSHSTERFPLVTIGIPTYNGAHRIGKAIESIANQDYPNIEILISDNASTDDTEAVCREFAKKYPNINYYRQPENRGILNNFDYVHRNASGAYFMWLSDDDFIKPGLVKEYVHFLDAHPDYSMVCAQTNYWKDGKFMHTETGMSVEHASPLRRMISMFMKNQGAGVIFGLLRIESANQLQWRHILGSDWYFMAGMAFFGKVKQLDFVGMQRDMGGVSETHKKMARIYGEPAIWGHLPYLRITMGTFIDVMKAPVYDRLPFPKRLFGAICASMGMAWNYWVYVFLYGMAGKLLRFFHIKTPQERARMQSREEQVFVTENQK